MEINHQIIDLDFTIDRLNCSKEMAVGVFQVFCDDLQKSVALIKTAYDNNDIQKTKKILHAIEGNLCFCCAPQLDKVIHHLHQEIKKVDALSLVKALYDQFYDEIDKVMKQFEKIKRLSY